MIKVVYEDEKGKHEVEIKFGLFDIAENIGKIIRSGFKGNIIVKVD